MPKPHITLTPLSAFRPRRRTSFLIWEHSSLTLIHYSHSHPQVKIDRHSPSLPVRPGNSLKIVPGNLPDGKENNLRTIPSMRTVIYKPWRSPSVVLNKPYRQLSLPSPARRNTLRQKRLSTKFWPRNRYQHQIYHYSASYNFVLDILDHSASFILNLQPHRALDLFAQTAREAKQYLNNLYRYRQAASQPPRGVYRRPLYPQNTGLLANIAPNFPENNFSQWKLQAPLEHQLHHF